MLKGKKLLILGAYNTEIGIINAAKRKGIYTIVTDNHTDWSPSPAKYVADEAWDISWSDIDTLAYMCKKHKIDGCIAGFSEKRVLQAAQLCSVMGYSFYADGADLESIFDKIKFKNACVNSGITVAKTFEREDDIEYPVIVKPADNAGSRGITICYSEEDIEHAYTKALNSSENSRVVIEEYITADEVMIFYTVHNGQCELSAMCDRIMQHFDPQITQLPTGYFYPSKYLPSFINNGDATYKKLIKNLGIENGLIGFQVFAHNGEFIPFDPTFRLDGTKTYYLTEHLNGISSMER